MKIEKISIHNLTSIEGEYTIDFTAEPLRSAGLFAITGDTGAGKSTILDAICLALYNRVPRFEKVENISRENLSLMENRAQQLSPNNVAALLRRGQKQGGATVVFLTNDGERYEAQWRIRVKRTGTYDRPVRTLTMLAPKKEKITDEKYLQTRIDAATGLTYDQFTRTVILAQNSFANFLAAKTADKAALLEKLTGTEIYGAISAQIFALAKEAQAKVDQLNHTMEGMRHDELDAAELAETSEQKRMLSAAIEQKSEQSTLLHKQLDWLDRYAQATTAMQTCEKAKLDADKAYVEMRSEEQHLDRYDSLLHMQPNFQAIMLLQESANKLKEKEALTANQLKSVNAELSEATHNLQTANDRTTDAEKQQALRQDQINKGYALTGEIAQAENQLQRINADAAEAELLLGQKRDTLRALQETILTEERSIATHTQKKQALEVHQLMFDRYDTVLDRLTQLTTETTKNVDLHTKMENAQQRAEQLRLQIGRTQQQQHDYEARLSALKSELHIHQQTNLGQDFVKLQRDAAETSRRLVALQHASTLWQHISAGYANLSEAQATLRREATECDQKKLEAARMKAELEATAEAYESIRTTYTLSHSDNFKHLREQLREGTACPLCGATHHPYHTETEREMGELLDNLSKSHDQLKQRLEQQQQAFNTMNEQIAADTARIKAMQAAYQASNQRQEADVAEWATCADLDPTFSDCSATVNRDARRMMINTLIDSTTQSETEAKSILEAFNYHQEHINRLNEEVAKIEDVATENRTKYNQTLSEKQFQEQFIETLKGDLLLSDKTCAQLYADLDQMITLSGWFATWRSNAEGLKSRLTELHNEWLITLRQLDGATRNLDLLKKEIKSLQASTEEAQQHLLTTINARSAQQELISNKREELRRMFGQSTPQEEAARLQRAVNKAREEAAARHDVYASLTAKRDTLAGERDNLDQSILDTQKDQHEQQEKLDFLMLRFNGTHAPVLMTELKNFFSDNPTDWNALRTRISALKDAALLANNNLEATRQTFLDVQAETIRPEQADEATRQQLLTNIATLEEEVKQLSEQLTIVQSRLLSHQNCLERAAGLQDQLTAAEDDLMEWQRLSDLLGSADGKKFRTLAQCYTFRFLVMQANYHLHQLSPRYELCQVPGTLALEIIDRDLFDEHRYVSSLSGGETFVVSLALALGLSSLSSASLSIGSLFIDEGFGYLDRSSLDLVMQALSNLENKQGRKVGIISHTEQIRSQISPQIQLHRCPGTNYSTISVR